jgi:hypothetical protein
MRGRMKAGFQIQHSTFQELKSAESRRAASTILDSRNWDAITERPLRWLTRERRWRTVLAWCRIEIRERWRQDVCRASAGFDPGIWNSGIWNS